MIDEIAERHWDPFALEDKNIFLFFIFFKKALILWAFQIHSPENQQQQKTDQGAGSMPFIIAVW